MTTKPPSHKFPSTYPTGKHVQKSVDFQGQSNQRALQLEIDSPDSEDLRDIIQDPTTKRTPILILRETTGKYYNTIVKNKQVSIIKDCNRYAGAATVAKHVDEEQYE